MYLTREDLTKGIYGEILTTIARSDDNVAQATSEAQAEVESYLTARYDIRAEWNRTGDARNQMVVKLVRDIALYNCYGISNPVNMPEIRRDKYKDAIAYLKEVQSERASIDGLSRLESSPAGSNYVRFGGNRKRKNQY